MAFLITSPMVDQVVVVLLGEAMGLNFTIAYIMVGSLIGVLGGVLIDMLKLDSWVEPYVWNIKMPTPATAEEASGWKWRES